MKLPNFAAKYANIVFILIFIFSIVVVIYAINRLLNPHTLFFVSPSFYFLCIFFGILSSILILLSFKLNKNLRVNISLILTSAVITMYGLEIILQNINKNISREKIAYKKNIAYDKRTKMEVVEDLLDSGMEVYPSLPVALKGGWCF